MTASFYPEQDSAVQPPDGPAVGAGRKRPLLRRARQARLAARALLLVLLAGWGAFALARDLIGLVAGNARGPVTAEEPAPIALARCEGSLTEARGEAGRDPEDAATWLRVASLELRRAELLALVAYETRHGPDWRQAWKTSPDTARWRLEFLRHDPTHCLTLASRAARSAARLERDPDRRRQALELLANARAGLGDHLGEAGALASAVGFEPENAALWMRLADAYGRAGQFANSEAARARGLALVDGEVPPR